jgi:hypothetical protein
VLFPSLAISWFILCIYNISAPPSLSLLREILLTGRVLKWSFITALWLMIINFMRMVYTFFMYSQSQQGKTFSGVLRRVNLFSREYAVAVLHWLITTLLVGLFWLFYLISLRKIWNCDFQDAI